MKRNVVPTNNFQILFTTRHLTSWAEGLARYEIRWEDLNSVVMVRNFAPTPSTLKFVVINPYIFNVGIRLRSVQNLS
jgi:hypothetical protein